MIAITIVIKPLFGWHIQAHKRSFTLLVLAILLTSIYIVLTAAQLETYCVVNYLN